MFIIFSFVDYVNLLFGVALLWQNKYLCLCLSHVHLYRLGYNFSLFLSFFFSLFFFYHYLLLNHKTQMDDIMEWYRVQNKLVCAWKWGCHVRGFPLKGELKNFELLNCLTEIGQIIRFGGYWWWLKHIKNWGSCDGGKWLKWIIQNSKKFFTQLK